MGTIPDLVGYKLEEALNVLQNIDKEIFVKETLGKKTIKSDNIRIIRQTILNDKLQLIISYF